MSVSVVIVHYETPDLLAECLRSLREHGGAAPLDILVVDNSRRLKARPALEAPESGPPAFHGVRLLENPDNVGFARAINQGIQNTAGEWILILNPDTRLAPGTLEELTRFGEAHPEAGILAPRLLNPDGTLQLSCRRFYSLRTLLYRRTPLARWMGDSRVVREHLMLDYDHCEPRVVDWVLGGAMLVRRTAVEDVGGADERFFLYFEDVDWCYRMGKRGWRVWYVPSSVMEHRHRRESARDFRGLRRHVVSTLRFYEKWSLMLYVAKQSRRWLHGTVLVLMDFACINLAFFLAFLVRALLASFLTKPLFAFSYYGNFLALINLVVLGTLLARGHYRRRRQDWAELLVEMTKSLSWACLIVMAATYAAYVKSYSRALVLLFFPLSIAMLVSGRLWVNRALGVVGQRLGTRPRAMLVGVQPMLGEAARRLERGDPSQEWCGRVDLERMGEGLQVAERASRLADQLRSERVQIVVLALPAARTQEMWQVAERCRALGVELHIYNELSPWIRPGDTLERLGPLHLLRVTPEAPVEQSPLARRLLEVVFALVLLPPALLALGFAWLGLLVSGRRPRWQREVWDNGRSEPLPLWRLDARRASAGASLERSAVSRGLMLFWVLTGRVGLVGGPLRPYAGNAVGKGPSDGTGVPAGITGSWFLEPDGPNPDADSRMQAYRSDLTTDLHILARSAARLLRRRPEAAGFSKGVSTE